MLIGLSIKRGLRRSKRAATIEIRESGLSTKQRAVVSLIFGKPLVEFVLLALVEGRAIATDGLEKHRARRGKEVGAAILDVADAIELSDLDIGVLHDLADFLFGNRHSSEPGAQIGFVGNDVTPHPGDDLLAALLQPVVRS